jgi:hypothetical protein
MRQVTKPLPGTTPKTTEVFFTRSGAYVGNIGDQMSAAAERIPNDGISRVTLNDLETALRTMREREADREQSVAKLAPLVADGERKVARLREDLANQNEAVEAHVRGARIEQKRAQIVLKFGEDSLAAYKIRLETSTRCLAAVKSLILEWYVVHGSLLAKLRKLAAGPRVGDKF